MPTSAPPAILHAHPFDARGLARRFRHSAVFGAPDALRPGEAMRFVNDHAAPVLRRADRDRVPRPRTRAIMIDLAIVV